MFQGCSGVVPGCSGGVPGMFRGVPGFTDTTPTLEPLAASLHGKVPILMKNGFYLITTRNIT